MSSNVPLPRTTRTTRITRTKRNETLKDNENANARPSRVTSRATALTATTATAQSEQPGSSRATAATAASKARASDSKTNNVAGKRKREVLLEVTDLVKNKRGKETADTTAQGKGKDVGVRGVTIVASTTTATAKTTRQPSRTVYAPTSRRSTRSSTASTTLSKQSSAKEETVKAEVVVVEDIPDENAVTIDRTTVPSAVEPPAPVFTFKRITPRVARAIPAPIVVSAIPKLGTEDGIEAPRVFHRPNTASPEDGERLLPDESQLEADRIENELVAVEVEEDPRDEVWDDLDAEDWDDPAMASEYVVDVCKYLKEVELSTLPNPDYMDLHPELDWDKRGILIDWVLQVHSRFRLLSESLFLFTNILDRFLSRRPISLSKLQLVGITCFFIAAKFEETMAPAVSEIAYLADGQYTVREILKAERYVLKIIDWDLRYPGPMGWLRRGSKADDCEEKARTVAKYLLEVGIVERRLVGTLPSLLAAAALWLARLVLGREVWTPNLAHYTTYSENELLPTANIMLNYILGPIQHESLFKKYAHRRFLKCSAYLRKWALNRWLEGTTVDLPQDLPLLKADIREERERAWAECEYES